MISKSKQKLTSSALGKGAISTIILKETPKLMGAYITTIKYNTNKLIKDWQTLIKAKLDTKVISTYRGKNKTPWPARRTGQLRNTILAPELEISKYKGTFGSGMNMPRYRFKYSGLFGVRSSADQADVGKYLNSWSGKPFAGWRTKAQRSLFLALRERMIDNAGLRTVETHLERVMKV